MTASDDSKVCLLGVVEGFYGQSWTWQDRANYAQSLDEMGLNSYIYAPKSDSYLRKQWRDHWPERQWQSLARFSEQSRSAGIIWGIGLSPFELYKNYSDSQKRLLTEKISRLNELQPDILAVLFDDMPGDQPDLAERQHEIVADICEQSGARRILVCPTYYSNDPVLESFFGQMPIGYWQDLGRLLPEQVELLWTGNRVCSDSISRGDLADITEKFRRLPTLWDNYPVNDGKEACKTLNLGPLSKRKLELGKDIQGHLCNPMNQPNLSRMPLASLALLHSGIQKNTGSYRDIFIAFCGEKVGNQLAQDMAVFQCGGLDSLSAEQLSQYKTRYKQLPGACAEEVFRWLNGEFAFDPECLTG